MKLSLLTFSFAILLHAASGVLALKKTSDVAAGGLRGAVDFHDESKATFDPGEDKGIDYSEDSMSDDDSNDSIDRNIEATTSETHSEENEARLPDFFPKEFVTRKKNSAEKRQDQRDRRRRHTNPYRTHEEEERERDRKDRQWKNSGRQDPYRNEDGSPSEYGRHRDAERERNCKLYGVDCEEEALA